MVNVLFCDRGGTLVPGVVSLPWQQGDQKGGCFDFESFFGGMTESSTVIAGQVMHIRTTVEQPYSIK